MKKLLLITMATIVMVSLAFAQSGISDPNPAQIGNDTAQQRLKEISISKFEDAGFWNATMPRDYGVVTLRRHEGSALDKELIPEEIDLGIVTELEDGTILGDQYTLGVKVQFYKRAASFFEIAPERPIPIEGITKTLSMWVVGRNTNHVLSVIISDFQGKRSEIVIGKLNYTGWKKLTVAIPPSIAQRDYHYSDRMGIKLEGFRIDCDPVETYGTYYLYLDDLRATTDLFAEETRDEDDMVDNW